MDLTARKQALEQTVVQATQQIGSWTEKLIGAKAQLALLVELEQEPTTTAATPTNGAVAHHPV